MSFSSREGRGTVKFGGDLVLIVREKESGKWGIKIERERERGQLADPHPTDAIDRFAKRVRK